MSAWRSILFLGGPLLAFGIASISIAAESPEIAALAKACDWDSASGCALLASDYRRGWGVAQDEKRAVELYGRSCALGSQVGCAGLKSKGGE